MLKKTRLMYFLTSLDHQNCSFRKCQGPELHWSSSWARRGDCERRLQLLKGLPLRIVRRGSLHVSSGNTHTLVFRYGWKLTNAIIASKTMTVLLFRKVIKCNSNLKCNFPSIFRPLWLRSWSCGTPATPPWLSSSAPCTAPSSLPSPIPLDGSPPRSCGTDR